MLATSFNNGSLTDQTLSACLTIARVGLNVRETNASGGGISSQRYGGGGAKVEGTEKRGIPMYRYFYQMFLFTDNYGWVSTCLAKLPFPIIETPERLSKPSDGRWARSRSSSFFVAVNLALYETTPHRADRSTIRVPAAMQASHGIQPTSAHRLTAHAPLAKRIPIRIRFVHWLRGISAPAGRPRAENDHLQVAGAAPGMSGKAYQ